MPKYEKQKCIHCTKYFEVLTEDHIFPNSWYPESTPANLEKWTAPSCSKCNECLGEVEESLLYRLLFFVDEKKIGALGINEKLKKRLSINQANKRSHGRQLKLIKEIVKDLSPVSYEEGMKNVIKGGEAKKGVRSRLMMKMPMENLHKVAEKIVRGLEYKFRNRLVEDDRKIEIVVPRNIKTELDLVQNWDMLITPEEEGVCRGPGVVVRYGSSPNDDNWVIYNIKIWEQFDVWAYVYPKNKQIKKQTEERTKSNILINEANDYFHKKDFNKSIKTINSSIKIDDKNFFAYFTKAGILFENNENKEALRALNYAINIKPGNYRALSLKVSILGMLGEYKKAVSVANIVLRNRIDEEVLYKKGVSLYQLEDFQKASYVFSEFLKLKPNHIGAILKQIAILAITGWHKESVELFESSDLPESNNSIMYNNLGYSYLQINDYSKSEETLNIAKSMTKEKDEDINGHVYGNLSLLYLKQKKYFKYLFNKVDYLYSLIKKTLVRSTRKSIREAEDYIFKGPGTIFYSDSQYRETFAIWKTFRSPFFWSFCNGSFNWFAVNIPTNLVDKTLPQGDIDLLVSMPKEEPPGMNKKTIYRAFEIKSVLVHKNGLLKSLKGGKTRKTYLQLKKLKEIGCEQVYLLELYLLERGFSDRYRFPTVKIRKEIDKKIEKLKTDGYGYSIMGHEPLTNSHEEGGMINHEPMCIVSSRNNEKQKGFINIVQHIERFYKNELSNYSEVDKFTIVTYCKKCRNLIILYADDTSFLCPKCRMSIL